MPGHPRHIGLSGNGAEIIVCVAMMKEKVGITINHGDIGRDGRVQGIEVGKRCGDRGCELDGGR
jgi:hypothetical protein